MQLSVCIDAVLAGQPIDDALQIIKTAGISAFEFWAWWQKDLDALIAAARGADLQVAACCTQFITLTDPARRDEYIRGLEESITAAKRLGCPTLISQVGDALPNVPREAQRQSLIDGLKQATPLLEAADITLVIEPLNVLVDHPGYFLVRSDEAFDIVDCVGSPRVKVVFDIYHQQVSEGHLIHNLTTNIRKIGHFHAAGNPGRHELAPSEINYQAVFDAIDGTGYGEFVGLEYWPLREPLDGLRETVAMVQC